jgi:hypothetical protein
VGGPAGGLRVGIFCSLGFGEDRLKVGDCPLESLYLFGGIVRPRAGLSASSDLGTAGHQLFELFAKHRYFCLAPADEFRWKRHMLSLFLALDICRSAGDATHSTV